MLFDIPEVFTGTGGCGCECEEGANDGIRNTYIL